MKQYPIIKLDKRHRGHGMFSHHVDFLVHQWIIDRDQANKDFLQVRNWCWESLGPSQEIEFMTRPRKGEFIPKWAWWRTDGHRSLYFTEDALSAYILKWH